MQRPTETTVDMAMPPRRVSGFRESYVVELGDWNEMVTGLLRDVVNDMGSVDAAAQAIGLDRADIESRLGRKRMLKPGLRDYYLVRTEGWARMQAGLLLAIVADATSMRAAAKLLGVPRATLSSRVRKARHVRGS